MSEAYHNDTSMIDNLNGLFAPVIALIKSNELWGTSECFLTHLTCLAKPSVCLVSNHPFSLDSTAHLKDLASPRTLRSRAQSLVAAKAAVNIPGAEVILNATIDLITTHNRTPSPSPSPSPLTLIFTPTPQSLIHTHRLTQPLTYLPVPIAEFLTDTAPSILLTAFWPLLPLSRGKIHINTSNPLFSHPIITPRFLHDPFDASIAISLARASRAVFSSSPFQGKDRDRNIVTDAYLGGGGLNPNSTNGEYLAWYKANAIGASHWLGSSCMLPRRLGGVVDSKLRSASLSLSLFPSLLLSFLLSAVSSYHIFFSLPLPSFLPSVFFFSPSSLLFFSPSSLLFFSSFLS